MSEKLFDLHMNQRTSNVRRRQQHYTKALIFPFTMINFCWREETTMSEKNERNAITNNDEKFIVVIFHIVEQKLQENSTESNDDSCQKKVYEKI